MDAKGLLETFAAALWSVENFVKLHENNMEINEQSQNPVLNSINEEEKEKGFIIVRVAIRWDSHFRKRDLSHFAKRIY